jgi:hypothetical protein
MKVSKLLGFLFQDGATLRPFKHTTLFIGSDGEGGAFSRFTLRLDLAAVGLGRFLADGQPQTDASSYNKTSPLISIDRGMFIRFVTQLRF